MEICLAMQNDKDDFVSQNSDDYDSSHPTGLRRQISEDSSALLIEVKASLGMKSSSADQ